METNPQNPNVGQRPVLKKVKRPINRMPQTAMPASANMAQATYQPAQQTTVEAPQAQAPEQVITQESAPVTPASQAQANPFAPKQATGSDAFNLDSYLDDSAVSAPEPVSETATQSVQRRFLGEEDLPPAEEFSDAPAESTVDNHSYMPSDIPPYLTKKVLIMLGCLIFFVGIITTKLFFTDEKVVRNGLQGVVVNPEVPKGRARCGVAERTQGCILYIMNPYRQEVMARDFYDLAAQLTGRQRFVIETGNMRYSNTKVRPGDIAQFNIPPL